RPHTGHAEPGALLVGETDDPDRSGRPEPPLPKQVEGGEGGHHAERPVVGPALADGVEMAAGDHARLSGGVAPPGPEVAVAVFGQVEAPARGLAREPVA